LFFQVLDNPNNCGVRGVSATGFHGQNFPNSKPTGSRYCGGIAICENQADLI
jgi:hypothetical protein